MGRNRRRLLVPEARAALEALKSDVMADKTVRATTTGGGQTPDGTPTGPASSAAAGVATQPNGTAQARAGSNGPGGSRSVADVARTLGIPYDARDNGGLSTREAGRIGGEIGGSMVQRLIAMAEQELLRRQRQERPGDTRE